MNKAILFLIIIILFAGGFYWYINSGEVLNEPAPSTEVEQEMNEESLEEPTKMEEMLPESFVEEETDEETMAEIEQMMEEAKTQEMTMEEKQEMEEKMMEMMEKDNNEEAEVVQTEPMTESEMVSLGASHEGSFTEIDAIHKGSGKAIIFPSTAEGPTLRLESFDVTRGPDLYVYLSKNANVRSSSDLGEFYNVAKLKSSKGNQNYQLPENYSDYNSVVIWCQAFGVLFSSANLQPL